MQKTIRRILLSPLSKLHVECEEGTEMDEDEQLIRKWFFDWMHATKEGDLELAKSLVADDAIFLIPGAGQMDKHNYCTAATATDPNTEFKLDCTIVEIRIFGDHAWILATISLDIIDKKTSTASSMKGDGISILERREADWLVVRDANTMVPVPVVQ
jgi:uncharacterized protein (TIGR02246 family)